MSRPGFSFLVSPDLELIREEIGRLLCSFPPEPGGLGAPAEYERHVFWGDEGLTEDFWENLALSGLFGGVKTLIVRRADKLKAEHFDKLTSGLARFNPSAWPFFCLEAPFDRGKPKIPRTLSNKPYWKVAKKKQWIWESPGLTAKAMPAFLQQWAKEKGFSFASNALQEAAAILPPDATAAKSELVKIELALDDGGVVDSQVLRLISHTPAMDAFEFLNAVMAGRNPLSVWRQILLSAAAGEEQLFPFLGLLQREARILWQLMVGDENVSLPPFLIKNKESLARRLGPQKIAAVLELAYEAEYGVKSGALPPDQAMQKLAADLMRRLGPGNAPPYAY